MPRRSSGFSGFPPSDAQNSNFIECLKAEIRLRRLIWIGDREQRLDFLPGEQAERSAAILIFLPGAAWFGRLNHTAGLAWATPSKIALELLLIFSIPARAGKLW